MRRKRTAQVGSSTYAVVVHIYVGSTARQMLGQLS